MPSPLASGHIETQRRLRVLTANELARIWQSLPGYDRDNVDEWLTRALPLINGAQRASVALTDAYLARVLGRQPLGVDPDGLTGAAVRNGTQPEAVYERPFVTVWTALTAGRQFADAAHAGMARAQELARFDVQASMRATAAAVQEADPGIYGYKRVADGDACAFCLMIDGAYVKNADAMALHNGCGCGLEPLTSPHRSAAKLPPGVAVHRHGEMGPVLGSPDHDFTTAAEIPAL